MGFCKGVRAGWVVAALAAAAWGWGCASKKPAAAGGTAAPPAGGAGEGVTKMLMDFEQANPDVTWEAADGAMATQPASTETAATGPAAGATASITRVSGRANTGLWALQVTMPQDGSGKVMHALKTPLDLRGADVLEMAVAHGDVPARSATYAAAVIATDVAGATITGDFYPIFSKYQMIGVELAGMPAAGGGGALQPFDAGQVKSIGLVIKPLKGAVVGAEDVAVKDRLRVVTDSWQTRTDRRTYVEQRMPVVGLDAAMPSVFYAKRSGGRIAVGVRGESSGYELTFTNGSTFGDADARPFLAVRQGAGGDAGPGKLVIGQPHTGLSLLGAEALGELQLQRGPAPKGEATLGSLGFSGAPGGGAASGDPGLPPWPGNGSTVTFECTWASPVAVLVEGKQQAGPYDRLGRPAKVLTWRFMIYQWGQVFVHVEAASEGAGGADQGAPVSWALALDEGSLTADPGVDAHSQEDAERLLAGLYPTGMRTEGVALPHQMQPGAPVAMLGKTLGAPGAAANTWWWAKRGPMRLFGTGIAGPGGSGGGAPPLDAMLLVNAPTAELQAGSFSSYLSPPRLRIRQGELDRNFPGDPDNDGFVDSYGFQVIRLANGRGAFTVYPDNRELFYPAFLFTVPAVERASLDVAHSRLLINVDGKQFADPPRFPDGSFLLQLPYRLSRPVLVEAVLVKK